MNVLKKYIKKNFSSEILKPLKIQGSWKMKRSVLLRITSLVIDVRQKSVQLS